MTSGLITTIGICYGFFIVIIVGNCQNAEFPHIVNFGASISGNKINLTQRIPVVIPGQCPDNMEWYTSPENKSAFICDCSFGHLYFSPKDSCYKPFRRGPCKPNEYLILPEDEVVAKCQVNPCRRDGLVPFEQGCYPLQDKEGPCGDDILGVNKTTFKVECMPVDLSPFVIIDAPEKDSDGCPPGSRRAQGICRMSL